MGFPLRSNIFRTGTVEQDYFARFPIQVAVLFSPSDDHFIQAFREMFLELDRLTGNQVAFFAVLDPPEDWIEEVKYRDWWQDYEAKIGRSGFSMNERVLVREIARLFGVPWRHLPTVVVSTNLWNGEYVTSGTSPFHIKKQLEILTNLVQEWGRPNIDQIYLTLSELLGFEAEYHPPDDILRARLDRTYGFLDTHHRSEHFNHRQYQNLLQKEYQEAERSLSQVQRQSGRIEGDYQEDQFADRVFEDAAGRLVAPATVAGRVFGRLREEMSGKLVETLEEEALVLVETSLTVGQFLEKMAQSESDGIQPLRFYPPRTERSLDRHSSPLVDFTPGAQGAWKAFELEINFSVIQAARAGRSIPMPEFFTRFDKEFPADRSKVLTGMEGRRKIFKNLNQEDRESRRTDRHRFLMLGESWYVAKALTESPEENFNEVITKCLGDRFPTPIMDAWEHICQLRNKASHTQALNQNEYAFILRSTLSPEVLSCLGKIKRRLSSR